MNKYRKNWILNDFNPMQKVNWFQIDYNSQSVSDNLKLVISMPNLVVKKGLDHKIMESHKETVKSNT